jgi:hypothetical protein
MTCDLGSSAPDWLIDYPQTAGVFAKYRLNTSCGGISVHYLCVRLGLNPEEVYEKLLEAARGGDVAVEPTVRPTVSPRNPEGFDPPQAAI